MPATVASRDTNFLDKWGNVTSDMRTASKKMSKILRHYDPRISPNEQQRFQLAVVTADEGSGNARRSVTQIYAIR
eukprot:1293048-Heterocapsa_arctica.AAC.1